MVVRLFIPSRSTAFFMFVACILLACFIPVNGSSIATAAYNTIENNESPLAKRSTLNFSGPGILCSDDGLDNRTNCVVNLFQIPNDPSSGTALDKLAKINSSGNATGATVADTNIPLWVVTNNAGTTGSATFAANALAVCTADAGGMTPGHFVVESTITDGDCMDAGTMRPTGTWVVGIAQTAALAGATFKVAVTAGFGG